MAGKWADAAKGSMSGKDEKPPKKEIDHVSTYKGKSGGHIHEHHHTHPDHHPVERHASANDAAMLAHMQSSMGAGAAPDGDPANATPPDPNAAASAGAATMGAGAPAAAAPVAAAAPAGM